MKEEILVEYENFINFIFVNNIAGCPTEALILLNILRIVRHVFMGLGGYLMTGISYAD